MVVSTIYVTRHGFRVNWTLNPDTGTYYSNISSPTKLPSDPPLAAYGVQQSHQLAAALASIKEPRISQVYSSPFYRCLETIQPFIEARGGEMEIRGDNGLGEWYGLARFDHPSPARPELLRSLFPTYSTSYAPSIIPAYHASTRPAGPSSPPAHPYTPSIIPSTAGESLPQLHARCAYALSCIIATADAESGAEPTAILLVTHAATLIAIGRSLTGVMPADVNAEDFRPFTCGISKFVRRQGPSMEAGDEGRELGKWVLGMPIPEVDWMGGKGVAGGWDCVTNGDCRHLDGGEERGCFYGPPDDYMWHRHFTGDEFFGDAGPEREDTIERKAQEALEKNDRGGSAKL